MLSRLQGRNPDALQGCFNELPKTAPLHLSSVQSFDSGAVRLRYAVRK